MSNRIKLKGTTEHVFDIGLTNKQTLDASGLTADRTWVLPDSAGALDDVLTTDGAGNLSWTAPTSGGVTSVDVSGANGIVSTGGPITSSGTIALTLGAITPTSVATTGTITATGNITGFGSITATGIINAGGNISGANLSGTNTGDTPPGGSTNDIQFNNAGAFAGDAALTYNPTGSALSTGLFSVVGNTIDAHAINLTTTGDGTGTDGSGVFITPKNVSTFQLQIEDNTSTVLSSLGFDGLGSIDFTVGGNYSQGVTNPSQGSMILAVNGFAADASAFYVFVTDYTDPVTPSGESASFFLETGGVSSISTTKSFQVNVGGSPVTAGSIYLAASNGVVTPASPSTITLVATDFSTPTQTFGGLTINADGTWLIMSTAIPAGTAGTSGQVLTSAGTGAAPTWSSPSDGQTPFYVPAGETFTVDANKQVLIGETLTLDGTLVVNGTLIDLIPNDNPSKASGAAGQIQYSNGSLLASSSNLTFNDSDPSWGNAPSLNINPIGTDSSLILGTDFSISTVGGAVNINSINEGIVIRTTLNGLIELDSFSNLYLIAGAAIVIQSGFELQFTTLDWTIAGSSGNATDVLTSEGVGSSPLWKSATVQPPQTLSTLTTGAFVGQMLPVTDANSGIGTITFWNGTNWIDIKTGIIVA